MVRLKDIAERAGVTVMTVSKVLNGAPDISSATRARVAALARQMGYVPNNMARSLRCRTSRSLGVVIPAATDPVFARLLLALEQKAHQSGYEIFLGHTFNQVEREEAVIRRLLARCVDGLLLCPVYRLAPTAPVYEELRQRGLKTVLLGHTAAFCRQFVNVESDDREAARQLTRHLLELGHQRIAFLAGPAASPACAERLDGYRQALREKGIEPDDRLVFNAGGTIEEGEKAAAQMTQEAAKATAVMGVNDLVAIGAARYFQARGSRIPQDLSVTGFGNILLAEHFRIPLTTARQPKFRLGETAMELLAKLLRGEPAESRRLPADIVIRESTAPPPA